MSDEVWIYVVPMANFSRSVEKLNLNQINKFKVYKRVYIFLSSIMQQISFYKVIKRFDSLIYWADRGGNFFQK